MDDFRSSNIVDASTYSDRRWVDLEAAELHAARARHERLNRRSVSSSPPRGRGRQMDPSETEDAPPGFGGETWFRDNITEGHKRASDGPGVVADAPDLRRNADETGPALVGKVTARCYEVDRRGETKHRSRELRNLSRQKPRPPGDAHAARPTVTAETRTVKPTAKIAKSVEERRVPETPLFALDRLKTASPTKDLRKVNTPSPRSDGVTFVWSGDSIDEKKSNNSSETSAPHIQETETAPTPTQAVEELGELLEEYKTRRDTRRRREKNATKTRVAANPKRSAALLRVSSFGSGAVASKTFGVASFRNGVGALCGRLVTTVRAQLQQSFTTTKAFVLNNPRLALTVSHPPLLGVRVGTQKGLGWFKIKEGDQALDHRGPGENSAVHAEATPRRSYLRADVAQGQGRTNGGGVTVVVGGEITFHRNFAGDEVYDSEDEDETRRALFENFDGYRDLGRDFAETCAAAAAAVAADAERLEKALRDADWSSPLSPQNDDENRSPEFHPFSPTPKRVSKRGSSSRSKVDTAKQLMIEDYENALVTRVRTLQRMFPEVTTEIATAVYQMRHSADAGEDEAAYGVTDTNSHKSPRKQTNIAVTDAPRVAVDVRYATRVVETLEAASVSVLMHGGVPTGDNMRHWLVELANNNSETGNPGARRDERGRGGGFGTRSPTSESSPTSDSDDGAAALQSEASASGGGGGGGKKKGSPKSVAAIGRLVGAFAGWAGRDADKAIGGGQKNASKEEDLLVTAHRTRRAFLAWHDVAATGPIGRHAADVVHRMHYENDNEIVAATPRSQTNTRVHATPFTTQTRTREVPFPLADRTNAPAPKTVSKTVSTKKPSPPRRFFNLIASPFAKRREFRNDSPQHDWGSSGSDVDTEGVSAGGGAASRGGRQVSNSSMGNQSTNDLSSSSDLWMSAGAALSTPGSVTSFGVTSRAPAPGAFELAAAETSRNAGGATPTVYFPSSPSHSAGAYSDASPEVESKHGRGGRAGAGNNAVATPEHTRLSRIADEFVWEDTKSPGPMGPVFRKGSKSPRNTEYELSPTSPLVGTRYGEQSRSPSSSETSGDEYKSFETKKMSRTSPPGSRGNKNAAAASVGAPSGFVTAARAAFEREAAARSYDAPTPTRGSRVRR